MFSAMPAPSRLNAARTAAQGFAAQEMAAEDLELTEAVVGYFAADEDATVRQTVAEAVKSCEFLSNAIALKLALDDDEIALPVVEQSPALRDEDLLLVLESASNAKQTAVAGRAHLGLKPTGWIAEHGCYPAIRVCLENETAIIGKSGYRHIMGRFGDVDPIQRLLVERPYLPAETVALLLDFITEEHRDILIERNPVTDTTSVHKILAAREKSLAKSLERRMTDYEQKKQCLALAREGRLSPTLMLRTLILDNHSFFAAALSHASGISKKRVISLTFERDYLGFQRLYERAGLPPYLYTAFRTTLEEYRRARQYHPRADRQTFFQRIIDRIAATYGFDEEMTLDELMEKLLPKRLH